jgi:hypothetical protein
MRFAVRTLTACYTVGITAGSARADVPTLPTAGEALTFMALLYLVPLLVALTISFAAKTPRPRPQRRRHKRRDRSADSETAHDRT